MKKSIKYIDLACDTERRKNNLFAKFLEFFGKEFDEFEKISWNGDNYYKLYFHDKHVTRATGWVSVSDFEVYGNREIMFIDPIKTNKFFGKLVKSRLSSEAKEEYSYAWKTKQEEILNEDKLEVSNF